MSEKFDFKKAIEELEEINRWFQEEEIDLDEGLEKLKRGKELIAKCRTRLGEAETEFVDIKKDLEEGDLAIEEKLDPDLDDLEFDLEE